MTLYGLSTCPIVRPFTLNVKYFVIILNFSCKSPLILVSSEVTSEKFNEIADHIINNMNRGVTVLQAQGWYTKKDKDVLLILINQKELPSLTRVIKEVDPRAFMSISPTNNVYGEGFEEIKTGVSLKKKKK